MQYTQVGQEGWKGMLSPDISCNFFELQKIKRLAAFFFNYSDSLNRRLFMPLVNISCGISNCRVSFHLMFRQLFLAGRGVFEQSNQEHYPAFQIPRICTSTL